MAFATALGRVNRQLERLLHGVLLFLLASFIVLIVYQIVSRNLGFHLLRQLGRWVPVTAHVLQLDPQRGGAALQKHQRAKLRLIRAVPRNHCPSSCLRHHLSRRRRSRRSRRSTCA